jgi:hypothetical protein
LPRQVRYAFSVFEFALIREMDSLAHARSASRPSVSPNSFRRFSNGSSRVKKYFPVGLRCGAAQTSGGAAAAAPPYLMDLKLILEAARGVSLFSSRQWRFYHRHWRGIRTGQGTTDYFQIFRPVGGVILHAAARLSFCC